MKRLLTYTWLLLTAGSGLANAQHMLCGTVLDSDNSPVDGVAVVLQTLDSVYLDAVVTDSLGAFCLDQQADKTYRLLFQHLLYEVAWKEVSTADAGTIRLTSKEYELDGVVVKAERRQVKIENGALKYNVPQLMEGKAVSNAFEVIRQIPGVIGTDDAVQLLGAGEPAIVLNGQLTTLSASQLISMLKTIPASRVQQVEVLYNAPAKYNIKGALINVILDAGASEINVLQGEVGADYLQKRYAGGKVHANLLYSTPRLNVDLLIDGYKGCEYSGEAGISRHTLEKQVTEVSQDGSSRLKRTVGTLRLGLDYTFRNEDKLSMAYYLNPEKSVAARSATTIFREVNLEQIAPDHRFSQTNKDDKSQLHNLHLQYDSHIGLTAGADFTHYHNPSFQHFLETAADSILTDLLNHSKQHILQGALQMNHTCTFETEWTLNWGVHGGFTSSQTDVDYLYNKGKGYEMELQENNRQKEYSGHVFAEVSKSIGEHFSAMVSLKGEYFKSDYLSAGNQTTLWNDWAFFPNASLSYVFNPKQILQLNVNSDKIYPSYWAVMPLQTPINSYSVIQGNPGLKPYRSYYGQLLYILNQKYTWLAFCQYSPNYFAQLPYQSTSELKNIFRYENMDFEFQAGVGAVVPFRVGNFWNGQVTLMGVRQQHKATRFHDLSFNNSKYIGQVMMNNTFTLSKSRPNLTLDLNGSYLTGAVQGVYDLGYVYDLSAALRWQFAADRATLTLKCSDLFQSNLPHTMTINQSGQYSRLQKLGDSRCFTVSFVWKFGGHKDTKHEKVDASRFGQS